MSATPQRMKLRRKHRLRIRCHASLRKEKPAKYSFMLSLRNLRDKKNPYRTNPIQSRNTLHGFTLMSFPKGKTCYIFVHASPPESPGQEKTCRTIPIQSRSTLHGFTHIFSPKGKTSVTYLLLLSSWEYPEQEKFISHDPDTVPQHPPRIHGHVFSERNPTCYTLFALAFFFGIYVSRAEKNSTEKKGYTIEKKNTIHYGSARPVNGQPPQAPIHSYTACVFLRAKTSP